MYGTRSDIIKFLNLIRHRRKLQSMMLVRDLERKRLERETQWRMKCIPSIYMQIVSMMKQLHRQGDSL